MIKFLTFLLLVTLSFFLFSKIVYAENSIQALILIPDDWKNRVDSQKIIDYKTNILTALKQVQTLLPNYSFSYSSDVKINDQPIGILDKTKLSSGGCLFDLAKSSLNFGFLNNIFGLSHKGQIYIFFVVGSGDVRNCYHEPELIFRLFGGDREVYINHDILDSLGSDQAASGILAQQLTEALGLSSKTPTSTPNTTQSSNSTLTPTPDPRVPPGKKYYDEDFQKGCRLKGGTRCVGTDKFRDGKSSFDNLCTDLGGISLGEDKEGGCDSAPGIHFACCKYVTTCDDVRGQCASPFDKSNTKFSNEPSHSLLPGYCPSNLYDWSKSGDLWQDSCWNDPAKGTYANFSSAANTSTPTPTPSSSPTAPPSPSSSPISTPTPNHKIICLTFLDIPPAGCTKVQTIGTSVVLDGVRYSCGSLTPYECAQDVSNTSTPTPTPTVSGTPISTPTPTPTLTSTPVTQQKKQITRITINDGRNVKDIESNFTQALNIRLPGTDGIAGTYLIIVTIEYNDGTNKLVTFTFNYKPVSISTSAPQVLETIAPP